MWSEGKGGKRKEVQSGRRAAEMTILLPALWRLLGCLLHSVRLGCSITLTSFRLHIALLLYLTQTTVLYPSIFYGSCSFHFVLGFALTSWISYSALDSVNTLFPLQQFRLIFGHGYCLFSFFPERNLLEFFITFEYHSNCNPSHTNNHETLSRVLFTISKSQKLTTADLLH